MRKKLEKSLSPASARTRWKSGRSWFIPHPHPKIGESFAIAIAVRAIRSRRGTIDPFTIDDIDVPKAAADKLAFLRDLDI